jgi:hypothetical protein
MGPYGFCLALGVTGLSVMALLGFGHHGGAGGHGHTGHIGQGHVGHTGHAGHTALGGHHGPGGVAQESPGGLAHAASFLSPRLLFSFLVGVGATGVLLRPWLFEPLLLGAALAGGVAFERFIIGPIWRFMFRFESRPAAMLESLLMEEAQAMMDFDAQGQGLIKLELDGQVIQLLGTLTAEEIQHARRVRRGDLLRIEDVDAARNRCIVSFAGQGPPEALP